MAFRITGETQIAGGTVIGTDKEVRRIASPSQCRNHGAVHGLAVQGAACREQGAGCRAGVEEVLAEHTVLISLCSMTLS